MAHDLHTRLIQPIPVRVRSSAIDDLAERCARGFGLQTHTSIQSLVVRLGGKVRYGSAPYPYGLSPVPGAPPVHAVIRGKGDFEFYLPATTTNARNRVIMASLLGHLFLHWPMANPDNKPGVAMLVTAWAADDDADARLCLLEASRFALSLLMPKDAVHNIADMEDRETLMGYVSKYFDVPLHVAGCRLRALGLMASEVVSPEVDEIAATGEVALP